MLPSDQLIPERAEDRASQRPCNVDPEVRPRARHQSRPNGSGRIHRGATDWPAKHGGEEDRPTNSKCRSLSNGSVVGGNRCTRRGPITHKQPSTSYDDEEPDDSAMGRTNRIPYAFRFLDDLEAARLIERRPDPADRRARRVVAMQLGTELLATLNDRLRATEAHLLAPLDFETRETFRAQVRLLATRAGALDPLDSPCDLAQAVDAERPSPPR